MSLVNSTDRLLRLYKSTVFRGILYACLSVVTSVKSCVKQEKESIALSLLVGAVPTTETLQVYHILRYFICLSVGTSVKSFVKLEKESIALSLPGWHGTDY